MCILYRSGHSAKIASTFKLKCVSNFLGSPKIKGRGLTHNVVPIFQNIFQGASARRQFVWQISETSDAHCSRIILLALGANRRSSQHANFQGNQKLPDAGSRETGKECTISDILNSMVNKFTSRRNKWEES